MLSRRMLTAATATGLIAGAFSRQDYKLLKTARSAGPEILQGT